MNLLKAQTILCLSGLIATGGCSSDDELAAGAGGAGGSGSGGALGSGGADGVTMNEGFIGGSCGSDGDCDYEGGSCLKEEAGFPGGMCSLDCAQFCPDKEGAAMTFCTEPEALGSTASDGLCIMRCDYGQSPSGCREGYQCQVVARFNESETKVYACLPGNDDPFQLSACHQDLLSRGVAFSPAVQPADSPDGQPNVVCEIEDPVWLAPVLQGVSFRPSRLESEPAALFTACPHALALNDAASVLAASNVSDLVHLGVYNCRTIAGSTKLSQHGRANAIDIAGVKLAGGAYFSVLDDWEKDQPSPTSEGGKLLRDIAVTLFEQSVYNIILTPDYDEDHADHLHCDLTPGGDLLK